MSYELLSRAGSFAGSMPANLIFWFLSHSFGLGELEFQVWLNSVELELSYELFSLAGSLAVCMPANLFLRFLSHSFDLGKLKFQVWLNSVEFKGQGTAE